MVAVIMIIYVIGALTRMNVLTSSYISFMFFVFYMTFWFGGIWAMLIFILSISWFIYGVYNLIRSRTGTST